MKKPKKGGWYFCDFKLTQVQNATDYSVETFDGLVRTGTLVTNCFPINLHTNQLSSCTQYASDDLHKAGKNAAVEKPNTRYCVNFPAIHNKLVDLWRELCLTKKNDEELSKKFNIFVADTKKALRTRNIKAKVQDVPIYFKQY